MNDNLRNLRKNLAIFFVSGLIIAGGVYLWPSGTPSESSMDSPNNSPNRNGPTTGPVAPKASRAEAEEAIGQLNEQSVAFYGRLIDQDGNSIGGAEIGGATLFNNMVSYGKRNYDTVSDADGYFVFPSIKGRDFNCSPRKPGYVYWPAKGYNGYVLSKLAPPNERFEPDPKKPEIFRMWKNKGAEVLLVSGLHMRVPPDGELLYLDMKSRKLSKNAGDLAFWCRYQVIPETTPFEQTAVEWEFGITVIGGGVIITDSRLPFEAPADGYQARWSFRNESGKRGSVDDQSFYLKTADGNYAVFNIHARNDPSSPNCLVSVGWRLNPSGSRNLELGKEQMLKGSSSQPGEQLSHIRQGGG